MSEKIEVTVSAKVPKKYGPLIKIFLEQNPGILQEAVDGWINQTRMSAAEAGVEVEDIISVVVSDNLDKMQKREIMQAQPPYWII